ncbi:MAG: hypothetical protein M3O15_16515, partial [Acidobacteriota bacterium]|nr:hypothetical protein [Acidobacteriota bacterium]
FLGLTCWAACAERSPRPHLPATAPAPLTTANLAPASVLTPIAPIELHLKPYIGTLKTVSVQAGTATLPFVLDTGGGLTIITPRVAKTLGCEPFGRLTGFRSSGERLDMQRCGPAPLHIGPLTVTREVASFDLMSLIGSFAPEVGGLITLDTLRDYAITLDLAHDLLVIESDASLAARVRGMSPMQARIASQAGGASLDLFVAVKARQGPLWLELDSGNSGPVLLAPHALAQLGLTPDVSNAPGSPAAPGAPDSKVPAQRTVSLDFLGLGPVEVTAREAPLIYDGLLNAETIGKMVLTLDLRTGRLWGSLPTR